MGWSSWCILQSGVGDRDIRTQADAMVAAGLADHGYAYVEIDDGWSVQLGGVAQPQPPRDAEGNILCNARFPDMASLTAYLHERGLKAGIYTSPGPLTCGMAEGSGGHEEQDARQFGRLGIRLPEVRSLLLPANQ